MNPGVAIGAFWLGVVLGTAPGPVQVLIIAEAARGGAARGLRTMLAANITFGFLLLALALGLSALEPSPEALRVIRVVGGAFLVWLGVGAYRERRRQVTDDPSVETTRPLLRGSLAVLLNPGVYLFLATAGAAVVADGAAAGGRSSAVVVALALLIGVATMDGLTVLLGVGARRLPPRAVGAILDVSAIALIVFGVVLVVAGIRA